MGTCLFANFFNLFCKNCKRLTKEQKNQYHIENMKSAELVLIKTDIMPKTHEDLKNWVIENRQLFTLHRCR